MLLQTLNHMLTWLFLMTSGGLAKLYSFFYLKVEVKGRENIPRDKSGVLFSSNHQTLIDSWFIMIFMRSYLYMMFNPGFLPWNTPEGTNYLRTPILQFIFKHHRCLEVKRGKMSKDEINEFFAKLKALLKTGNLLIFFEETRTRDSDEKIGKAKLGAGTIAYKTQCTIIPIRIKGFSQVMQVGSKLWHFLIPPWLPWKRKKVTITYGKPVKYVDLLRKPDEVRTYLEISQRIKKAVEEL